MEASRGSLLGKVCMVTGANFEFGRETAAGLADLGAKVVLVSDPDHVKSTQARVAAGTGSQSLEVMGADFNSLDSIRSLARDFKARHDRLHVLVNNTSLHPGRILRPDISALITVPFLSLNSHMHARVLDFHHLASFLLTNLLLDALKASAPARIVNVAEGLQLGRHQWDDFETYYTSKLASMLFTYELARRLADTEVTANVFYPGGVSFEPGLAAAVRSLRLEIPRPRIGVIVARTFEMMDPVQAALTSITLASSPEVAGMSGRYFYKKRLRKAIVAAEIAPIPEHERGARNLWEASAQLTGLPS